MPPAHTLFMADCRFRYSRVALKKYVKANNNINATDKMFDVLFNKALKTGVEKGEFSQPKGECSTILPSRRNARAPSPFYTMLQ
jgi:histone H1/5